MCGRNQSLADCNEDLEYEQNTNTVYHSKSGNPFTGTCESCYFNGRRQHCVSFRNGKEDGVSTSWYEDGAKNTVRMHSAGIETGTWMFWYPSVDGKTQGQLAWEISYSEGKKNGTSRFYFEDGGEKKIENYKMGALDGQTIKYKRKGVLEKEMNYRSGLLDGPYKSYFENGNVQTELNYKNGKEDGEVKYYHENAQLALEGEYKMGVKIGKWQRYHPSGIDMIIENFNNIGQLDGMVFEYWPEDGKLKREAYYQSDQLVVEQRYDEFGNPIDEFDNRINPEDAVNVQAEATKGTSAGKKKKEKKKKEKKQKDKD